MEGMCVRSGACVYMHGVWCIGASVEGVAGMCVESGAWGEVRGWRVCAWGEEFGCICVGCGVSVEDEVGMCVE